MPNRVDPSDIAAARAVPIAAVVGPIVALKRDFGLCPFHNEQSPSFHIHRKRNLWKCFGCGAGGDTITFLRRACHLDFPDAVAALVGGQIPNGRGARPAIAQPMRRDDVEETRRVEAARSVWERAEYREQLGYLYMRAITPRRVPDAIRYLPELWCGEAGRSFPALVCRVDDGNGYLCAVQRIWLAEHYECGASTKALRAPVVHAKKTLGPCRDGAVRLAPAGPVLGLAEGVETALACRQLYSLPVWATLGTTRLGSVTLPRCVRQIILFGDNGSAGEAGTAKAEKEYARRGYSVMTQFPPTVYGDFNDQLMARS